MLGIEFVSLSENLDTATPAGRMVFIMIGAVAELERSLRAAVADAKRIGERRASGISWRAIGRELGLSGETVKKIAQT